MPELTWREAIVKVLEEAEEPLHYAAIADLILDQGLRTTAGATPRNIVSREIGASLREEADSPFERTGRGFYRLKGHSPTPTADDWDAPLVAAFGAHWRRDKVQWAGGNPHLYGRQGHKGDSIDLGGQRGIYVLYNALGVVYVGQALKQSIARRLYQHTYDRLAARWQYFSWFGLRPVLDDGKLGDTEGSASASSLVDGLEAILIEALEPRLNRQGGRGFDGREYMQARDPRL